MAITEDIAKVSADFDNARAKAYQAIDSLSLKGMSSTFAIYGAEGLYATNPYIPIERITIADSMIETVMDLAGAISSIEFLPPRPITDFEMSNHKIWQDAFANKIEGSLSAYVSSMGIPDKIYQDAIFEEDKQRKLQTLNDLYELADAKTGARGFTYPNDHGTILKLDAQQKYQFDLTQIGRDISKLVTEWARQNYQFAIDKGIALETFHADFTYKYCTAFVDIYKNLVLAAVERFKADISKYIEPIRALVEAAKLPVEVAKLNSDISKANADIEAQENARKIDEAIKVFDIKSRQFITIFGEQIKALSAVAQDTASMVQAASRSVINIQKA